MNLWAEAYRTLPKKHSELVQRYEAKLHPNADGHPLLVGHSINPFNEMSTILETEIAKIEDKKWRLKFGSKSVEVRTQIERIIQFVFAAKDFVGSAEGMDQVLYGLPWAGTCLLLRVSLLAYSDTLTKL